MFLAASGGYLPPAQDNMTSFTKLGGNATFFKMNKEVQAQIDELTTCKLCGDKMFLLAQSFCPIEDERDDGEDGPLAENRMMYVYACNSCKCNNGTGDRSVVCFTVQADEEDTDALNAEDDYDVTENPTNTDALAPHTFPAVILDVVDEPPEEETVTDPSDLEKELIKMAEKNAEAGDMPDEEIKQLEEAVDLKDKHEDEMFEDFRTRLNRLPSQCLRYQRGGEPLFMNPTLVESNMAGGKGAIPKCPDCGGPCVMEMQIMPTAAYFLKVGDFVSKSKKDDDGLDIGTFTVYTCAKGCLHGKKGLLIREHFVYVESPPTLESDQVNESRPTMRDVFMKPLGEGAADGSGSDTEKQ